MYSTKPSYVFGFHGLDKTIAYDILTHEKQFKHSSNNHDWLGHGVYFWENNLERARQYAIEDMQRTNSKIKEPFVLGTILDLGNCLDLLDQKNLDLLKVAYEELEKDLKQEKLHYHKINHLEKMILISKKENLIVPLLDMLIN